jgi:hypothetical protein
MTEDQTLLSSIYKGWKTCQSALIEALRLLDPEQLALRSAPNLRSIGQIAAHIIGARARWFYLLMGEGGNEFKALGKWDRRGSRPRSADELISGLELTEGSMGLLLDGLQRSGSRLGKVKMKASRRSSLVSG